MGIKVVREGAENELLKTTLEKGLDKTFVAEKINEIKSETENKVKTTYIPRFYLVVVVILFFISNLSITYILYFGFNSDIAIIENLKPEELMNYNRLIDTKVVVALVAGTTAQVGASFYLVTKFFTRSQNAE